MQSMDKQLLQHVRYTANAHYPYRKVLSLFIVVGIFFKYCGILFL